MQQARRRATGALAETSSWDQAALARSAERQLRAAPRRPAEIRQRPARTPKADPILPVVRQPGAPLREQAAALRWPEPLQPREALGQPAARVLKPMSLWAALRSWRRRSAMPRA